MSGTSGGITTNGVWGYGVFDSGQWPIILDLLDEAHVSWKICSIGSDDVVAGDGDNVAVFWSRWAHDPRTTATTQDYFDGGFFDHGAPPQIDAYGLGIRVPLWVVSPHARKGPVISARPADHTSTLKLIERLHGLPTLASRNHAFDTFTPTGANYDAGGAPVSPRDGLHTISDLFDLFAF